MSNDKNPSAIPGENCQWYDTPNSDQDEEIESLCGYHAYGLTPNEFIDESIPECVICCTHVNECPSMLCVSNSIDACSRRQRERCTCPRCHA